jgi:arachidonate 5-lipoxygenase
MKQSGSLWGRVKLWFAARLFIVLVALGSGTRRRRMSHNNATAGRGKARIVDDPEFPETEFFEAGREFPCRIRHAAVAYWDDSMHVARSATLKFADTSFESPFDVQMNTGRYAFFWNARTFLQFAFWRKEQQGIEYEKYYKRYPQGRKAAASAFRRNPSSYGQLFFHSQTPFGWHAKDGKLRYAKFRLIPEDGIESAAPTQEFVDECFRDEAMAPKLANQRTLPGETRSINYLKNEYTERLAKGSIKYRLQLQLLEHQDDQDPEVLNPHVYWDEETCPFMELATIDIDEALSFDEMSWLTYEITHMPDSMSILKATDMEDYNSLNSMRVQAIWAIRSRWFFQRLFGVRPNYPDDHKHDFNPPGM